MIQNSSMTFGHSSRSAIPRGAAWAASVATVVSMAIRRLDRWLVARREARAALRPQPAQEPRSAEEVLAWAARLDANEPGFANDLRAAVWRAEEKAF